VDVHVPIHRLRLVGPPDDDDADDHDDDDDDDDDADDGTGGAPVFGLLQGRYEIYVGGSAPGQYAATATAHGVADNGQHGDNGEGNGVERRQFLITDLHVD
jgi:hypothetical protein